MRNYLRYGLTLFFFSQSLIFSFSQSLIFIELNCENLFDTRHDEGKQDEEFTPEGTRRWTRTRYWRKLNAIGQDILSCAEQLPSLVALVEVENDTVMHDLTRRSLLRNAGYEYLMTESPDVRGMNVALLYQPARFRPICYDALEVPTLPDMRPTRQILYVKGETQRGDTLHFFVVHAPSRYGGELETRPYRRQVIDVLSTALDTLMEKNVVVAGDFNDYAESPSMQMLTTTGLLNVSVNATGAEGRAKGTYRYRGEWHSLDHILLSPTLSERLDSIYINDATFLLEPEDIYGGWKPRRTFNGYRYQRGFSDHLPLVLLLHE
ncbi:MAG: endonuclease/exonuclease/phosphatase family protein [Prevotella sp.]|nr:endonuclease/exonuclease/phosphatase family protein [Prevotella sp.]